MPPSRETVSVHRAVSCSNGRVGRSKPRRARWMAGSRRPASPSPSETGPDPSRYCSACGVRNPEGRPFCRSGGETLRSGAAAQAPAPGWWRRLLNRLRGRRSYAAGDRPRGFLSHDAVPGLPAGAAATAAGHRLGAPADSHRLGVPIHSSSLGVPAHSSSLGASAAGTRGPGAFRGTAGQRMRRAKTPLRGTLSRFAPLLLVVGLLGVGLGPARMWLTVHVFGLAHRAQVQLSQRYTNVAPISASASSAAPGHPAKLAIDGIQQTYWLTGAGSGAGASFTVRFASPQRIDRVGVLSGEPGGDYRTQARPQTIELLVGGRSPVSLPLDDTLGFQNRPVSLRGVTVITVVVKNVYPGQNGQAVALRELEFFARV